MAYELVGCVNSQTFAIFAALTKRELKMKPTNEQIEQYRLIVADAPDGATHYANHLGYRPCVEEYLMYSDDAGWFINNHKVWVDVLCELDQFNSIHCLDDLRANIAMHDENLALREIVEAVACIGIDFGHDKFELQQEHIDKARELLK